MHFFSLFPFELGYDCVAQVVLKFIVSPQLV